MLVFKAGDPASIRIDLASPSYPPDEAFWLVEDEAGTVLLAEAEVPIAWTDNGFVTVLVPDNINTAPTGRSLRRIVLRYRQLDATGDNWLEAELLYIVEADAPSLVVQGNSFQTYGQAMLLASTMLDVDTLLAATPDGRINALAESWRALARLNYDRAFSDDMNRITDFPGSSPGSLLHMSATEFLSLDPRMIEALCRAQVVEAEYRLASANAEPDGRDSGLVSSRIAEVEQRWRPVRSLASVLSISPRAMKELGGYLVIAPRVGRGPMA